MGGIIPPIVAKKSIIMSRKNRQNRASRATARCGTPSRHRYLDTPLWLVLYWIDLAIATSGFLRRRSLLRLRNSLLDFLSVPCGAVWEVHLNPKKKVGSYAHENR